MEVQQNFSLRETQTLYRTVVDVDMVGYSTTARLLEQNMGSSAVADLNRQIQDLIGSALRYMPSPSAYSKIKETGDGILLLFEAPQYAHLFAEQLHLNAQKHNRGRTDEIAQRHFRIGIATGEITREVCDLDEIKYAGMAITDAVRFESAAASGEIVIDLATYSLLPEPDRRSYGPETTVTSKHSEIFSVRRYQVGDSTPKAESIWQQISHHWVTAIATALATLIAAIGLVLHLRQPPPTPDQWVLQSIQAKPNPAHKGQRIAVTIGLDHAAPPGGLSVSLTSSDPAILAVNGNLVVFQGESNGTAYLQALETPSYSDPIEVRAQYQKQAVRTQVVFNRDDTTIQLLKKPDAVVKPSSQLLASKPASNSTLTNRESPPVNSQPPAAVSVASALRPLDPELISRLEDAQGRLSAENSYWENVKTHMPAGSSLRPEITSQIFSAGSASRRCNTARQASDASSLSACIDALNDHLTQLRIQH